MKLKQLFLVLTALVAPGGAAAQFSMSTTGQNSDIAIPIPFNPGSVDARVINATEAEMLRKVEWRRHNAVDFRISATGIVTQFNKSWTTNNQNVVSSEIAAYYYHTYARERHTSLFKFDGIYGMNYIDDVWFKNQDVLKLYYLASWALQKQGVLKNWAYGFSAAFASQFSEGYKGRNGADRQKVWSNFMAPGTLQAGLGLTYTSPDSKLPFIVTINPVSGNALFVQDSRIDDERRAKLGILLPGDAVAGNHDYTDYRHKVEGGSSVTVDFDRTFLFGRKKAVALRYKTTLTSFYGWMTEVSKRGSATEPAILPTAGWTNSIIFDPLSFITFEFRTTTLYDRSQVDKVQMQYYVRVGLTYRYKNR